MQTIPVIDIAPWFHGEAAAKDAVARKLAEACEQWGFFLVSGHGLDPRLVERIRAVTTAFFDLPLASKMRIAATGRPGGRGYYRLESKSHARTRGQADAPGDLRETFYSGMEPVAGDAYFATAAARRHFAPNVWPVELDAMASVWGEYMRACDRIATELLRICARALGLSDSYFDDKINHPISTLTAQHYPALDAPARPGQVRSGEHTDFGALTLLLTEDRPGGLQVESLDGEWRDVRPVPGTFIVNLGDMMARWTNDRWRSTPHRVVNPPADAGAAARRLSIVYFHTPNYDAVIACIPATEGAKSTPRYPAITAGEHLAEKLRTTDSVAATIKGGASA